MRQRVLDALNGTWISPDPLGVTLDAHGDPGVRFNHLLFVCRCRSAANTSDSLGLFALFHHGHMTNTLLTILGWGPLTVTFAARGAEADSMFSPAMRSDLQFAHAMRQSKPPEEPVVSVARWDRVEATGD